jgi:hypothetical protein
MKYSFANSINIKRVRQESARHEEWNFHNPSDDLISFLFEGIYHVGVLGRRKSSSHQLDLPSFRQ